MFKGLGNLMSLMKQAQSISGRVKAVSEQLRGKRATGSAGGGLVELEVNGLGEVLRCRIDPALAAKGDREMLEDLVAAAANDAAAKAKALHMEAMQGLAGGIELPGMEDALAKLTGMAPGGEEEVAADDEDGSDDGKDRGSDKPESG
jgi:DNA-binding YbaB/EbfC family protein